MTSRKSMIWNKTSTGRPSSGDEQWEERMMRAPSPASLPSRPSSPYSLLPSDPFPSSIIGRAPAATPATAVELPLPPLARRTPPPSPQPPSSSVVLSVVIRPDDDASVPASSPEAAAGTAAVGADGDAGDAAAGVPAPARAPASAGVRSRWRVCAMRWSSTGSMLLRFVPAIPSPDEYRLFVVCLP